LKYAWSLITLWGWVKLFLAKYCIFFIFSKSNSYGSTLIMSLYEFIRSFDSLHGPINFWIRPTFSILTLSVFKRSLVTMLSFLKRCCLVFL
jgi:hypothetical protein